MLFVFDNYALCIVNYEFPPRRVACPNNYALCIMNYELNQNAVAVVDFMLDNLGCKASEFLPLWFEIKV